jgi:glycerol kinase
MQMQADILGLTVIRPKTTETTALGAAYAAGLALGIWNDMDELQQHWREDRRWEPTSTEDQRTERFRTWRKAVERSFDWIEFDEGR